MIKEKGQTLIKKDERKVLPMFAALEQGKFELAKEWSFPACKCSEQNQVLKMTVYEREILKKLIAKSSIYCNAFPRPQTFEYKHDSQILSFFNDMNIKSDPNKEDTTGIIKLLVILP